MSDSNSHGENTVEEIDVSVEEDRLKRYVNLDLLSPKVEARWAGRA